MEKNCETFGLKPKKYNNYSHKHFNYHKEGKYHKQGKRKEKYQTNEYENKENVRESNYENKQIEDEYENLGVRKQGIMTPKNSIETSNGKTTPYEFVENPIDFKYINGRQKLNGYSDNRNGYKNHFYNKFDEKVSAYRQYRNSLNY